MRPRPGACHAACWNDGHVGRVASPSSDIHVVPGQVVDVGEQVEGLSEVLLRRDGVTGLGGELAQRVHRQPRSKRIPRFRECAAARSAASRPVSRSWRR